MDTDSPLRVLVMGAGALGCVTGGFMAKAGHEMHLVGRKRNMDSVRDNGIRITGIWGEHHATGLRTYTSVADVPEIEFDLVIICVKSYDTDAALGEISPYVSDETLVCSYQNGLGNAELIARHYGWERCVECRVIYGARLNSPGCVEVTVMAHKTALGVYRETPHLEKIKRIADAMDASGVPTEFLEDIVPSLWAKFAYSCSLNPLSALLNVPYANLLDTEESKATMRGVIEELYAVGTALDVALEPPTPAEYIEMLFGTLIPNTGTHYASMREDLIGERRTEIDALNGALCRYGEELGIVTPVNAELTERVRVRERGYL